MGFANDIENIDDRVFIRNIHFKALEFKAYVSHGLNSFAGLVSVEISNDHLCPGFQKSLGGSESDTTCPAGH